MIKRLLIYSVVFLMIVPFANAGSIGISPAGFKLFFEPNLERRFVFNVFNADLRQDIEIYVKGDLSEYVSLSHTSFVGRGALNVDLRLPEKIDKPGNHRILIGAIEVNKSLGSEETGIGGIAAVQVPIDIFVPYPGKYAEVNFRVNNINEGENAKYEIEVHNLGTEEIIFQPLLEVYEGNELIDRDLLGVERIKSKKKITISDYLNSSNFRAGVYRVILSMDYGREVEIERELKVGTLFVNITDYSHRFEPEKANEFYIEVESLWNSKLEKVYSEVFVSDKGNIIKEFRLSFIDLDPWERANFTGFFSTFGIDEGRYLANIRIVYENKTTYKLVAIYVEKPPLDPLKVVLFVVVGVFFVVLIGVVVYLIWRVKKLKKVGKSRKNVSRKFKKR